MKESLVEILMGLGTYNNEECEHCHKDCDDRCFCEKTADYLMERGVTVLRCNMDCRKCWKTQLVTPRWIPVTERLPELHTKVLCCGIKGGRFIAELGTWGHENHLYWDKKNGQGCPTVTHWMPLPEPPKGE